MEFFDLLERRRSIRVYTGEPVGDVALEQVLRASASAPSAGDLQSYEVVVVRSMARRQELARAAHGQGFLAEAAVVLCFLADTARAAGRYGRRGATLFAMQDATIAAAYAQLAAHALGLGTVWVGAFDDELVRSAVGAPSSLQPVSLLAIGHAAEHPDAPPRRHLADMVHDERILSPHVRRTRR